MFSRLLGYYTIRDVWAFLRPSPVSAVDLAPFLPDRLCQVFGAGREALFAALQHVAERGRDRGRRVLVPAWGCPIVLATVHRAGLVPVLVDVRPESLHFDPDAVEQATAREPTAAAILVAENGIPYSGEEVQRLRQGGMAFIADLAVAWPNVDAARAIDADYEILSGGFSKPVSGLGLGVLATALNLPTPTRLPPAARPGDVVRLLAHLVCQQPRWYGLLRGFVPAGLDAEYDGVLREASPRSLSVALNSLRRQWPLRPRMMELQAEIRALLQVRGSHCAFVRRPDVLHTKVLCEQRLFRSARGAIELHQQYAYDLLADPRAARLDSDYPGVRAIRTEYVSFTINAAALQCRGDFLRALQAVLR